MTKKKSDVLQFPVRKPANTGARNGSVFVHSHSETVLIEGMKHHFYDYEVIFIPARGEVEKLDGLFTTFVQAREAGRVFAENVNAVFES
jgi:hypothetical protein